MFRPGGGHRSRARASTALVLAPVLLASLVVGSGLPAYGAGDTITVSAPDQQAYQFQGFGVSLAWWANVVGGWPPAVRQQIDNALFATSDLANPNRLGLTIARYNIGASPTVGNPPLPDKSKLPFFCQADFVPGGAVPSPVPGRGAAVDLTRDANQLAVLTDAWSTVTASGETPVFEAFANSPPWWLAANGCPMGNGNLIFGFDNLNLPDYGAYADYLIQVVQAIRAEKGVTFTTLEPFNEPENPWNPDLRGPGKPQQEGAHFDPGSQSTLLPILCQHINSQGGNVLVSAPDGFNPDTTLTDFGAYGQGAKDCVARLNTHMYSIGNISVFPPKADLVPYTGSGRRQLAATAQATPVPLRTWVSEFGAGGGADDIGPGTKLATQIARDIRYLRARGWVYWQAVEGGGGWGLFEAPSFPNQRPLAANFPDEIHTDTGTVTPTKRFYALEQYSRFIHPGDWIVAASDPAVDNAASEQASTVAALDQRAGTLTIVTTNDTNNPRTPTYDLSAVASSLTTGNVQVFRTDPNLNARPDAQPLQLTNGQFTDTQQPHSINTYVIGLPGLPSVGFPPNQPPVVNAGPNVTGPETTPIALHGSATDPDGDLVRAHWTWAAADGQTDPAATCAFADPSAQDTTITCSDEGDFTAALTADDGVNLPVSDSATVHATNLGPQIAITAPDPWQATKAPATIDLTAPITDPGAHDTHTCTITWDDGTPPETFPQEGSCDRSHTFTEPGVYTIGVTVADDDHHTATADVVAVVFDPAAGFVTGGGWIDSPPGSYTPDPSIGGKAHFTLQARYPSGSTTPDGNIAFRLQDAHVRLDATTLDWLVITPNGQAGVKGSGTLAGQAVGFLLYGYQGCVGNATNGCQPGPDRFRAIIWPAAQGTVPTGPFIYDNVPGGDLELADAQPQALGGGSIQIHR